MFLFRLAGHLSMTVGELCERMTSAELTEWQAVDMYYEPLPSPWRQTGTLASATIAPHCKRGQTPKPDDFVPVVKPPQTPEEMAAEFAKLEAFANATKAKK